MHYCNAFFSFPDAVGEANMGLIKAVDRYDPEMGNRFSTFAVWWIRQSILYEFYRNETIKPNTGSSSVKVKFYKILSDDKKLANVMRTIKFIDKDHNGYVTVTELDDILKIEFPVLAHRDIKPIIKMFSSF